jgi:hypothetical protein
MEYEKFFVSTDDLNLQRWQGYDLENFDPSKFLPIVQKVQNKIKADTKRRRKIPGVVFTPINIRSTKNIVKNYGNAIASFAVSELAVPYLGSLLASEGLDLQGFQQYVYEKKNSLTNISNFRTLLKEYHEDGELENAFKRVFKSVAEIFVKYFSVNWIFSGKITYRDEHLRFRSKMLRRIKNPDLFTYLKGKI